LDLIRHKVALSDLLTWRPYLELNRKWIGWLVAEIAQFEIFFMMRGRLSVSCQSWILYHARIIWKQL